MEEVKEVGIGRGAWLTQGKQVEDVGVEARRGHAAAGRATLKPRGSCMRKPAVLFWFCEQVISVPDTS